MTSEVMAAMTSEVIDGPPPRSHDAAMTEDQTDRFIADYMAMWHEPDPVRRRARVVALWAPDAENVTRRFVVRGLDEIAARVDRAHQEWVADKGFVFRPAGNTSAHNHLIKFVWEMVPGAGGPVDSRGLDIFVLTADDKIRALYQFAEPLPR